MSEIKMEDIVSLCKRRGFIYPGSDVYGGLAGTWDYGPLGLALKRNIMDLWWKTFVDARDDMYGVDAAILMNQKVWQASGHVDTFTDPLVECRECNSRFREDQLVSDKCPNCGKSNAFSEARQFNMMFETKIGPMADTVGFEVKRDLIEKMHEAGGDHMHYLTNESVSKRGANVVYLRPETAQGIFTNFKNVVDSFYPDLPFGIAQQGKAFRNEISPRDFVFRSREFEQMEIEYFVAEKNWEKEFEKWVKDIESFLDELGLPKSNIHKLEVPEDDRAHYSKRTIDFEFDYPIGRKELLGLAYRTNFDLMNIQNASGKSMEYTVKGTAEKFVPHVIEPSFGVERLLMAILVSSLVEDEVNGEKRTVLKLKPELAPYRIAVSPLLKNKEELVAKAREVYKTLKAEIGNVMWDDNGNIGKRYRRQDEIGTPYCVVIDFDTLEDDTVTIRDRDTTEQTRVKISELADKVR